MPAVFALLTSADLAPFFAALSMFVPEVMAVVALPLLVLLLVRGMGRQSVGSLQQVLAAKTGRSAPVMAVSVGVTGRRHQPGPHGLGPAASKVAPVKPFSRRTLGVRP